MTPQERSWLASLDVILRSDPVSDQLDQVVQCARRKLAADRTAVMAWEPILLTIFGETLPPAVRSSWVFILRAGATTGAERHPNSHQRMMSYQGSGDLQTGGEGHWQSQHLTSDPRAELERRWISIAPNVWHQAVVPDDGDWTVVSFHTVPTEELIEERPDAGDVGRTRQRRYVGP